MQTAVREIGRPIFVPLDATVQEVPVQQVELNEDDEFECLGNFDYPVDMSFDPDFKKKSLYTHEEIWDDFCKKLGQHYGLADIRDAK